MGNTNTQNRASGSRMNSKNRTRVSCTSGWSANEFERGAFFSATRARTSGMVWSLISQMASRQSYKDVLQCGRVSSQFGEWNILPREFREQSGDGSMKLGHLHEHNAIFRSHFTDADDAAQGRHIERFRNAARRKLHHLFRARCGDQFARGAESDHFAMIQDGHAVAKALGFVHIVGGEQNCAARLF